MNLSAKLKLLATFILLAGLRLTAAGSELMVITELLKDPLGLESAMGSGKSHEFVEFTNFGTDTFFIDSLFISDGTEANTILPYTAVHSYHATCLINTTAIAPGHTAIILDPDYAAASATNHFTIDSGTVLLTIDDNEFGSSGLSNDDGVFIYKGSKTLIRQTIASFTDDTLNLVPIGSVVQQLSPTGIPEGFSIIPRYLLSSPAEFEPCPDSLSPGHYEYLKPGWLIEYRLGQIAQDLSIQCSVYCKKTVVPINGNAAVEISSAGNQPIQSTVVTTDSIVRFSGPLPLDGKPIQILISYNNAVLTIPIDLSSAYLPAGAIRITEIFPRATGAIPEWFELTNTSAMAINLKNWQCGSTIQSYEITARNLILAPGKFIVVTSNAALFQNSYPSCTALIEPLRFCSLDNYHDTLILRSNRGQTCETVFYHSTWFTNWDNQSIVNINLEKPANDRLSWVLTNNPSPGQPNTETPRYVENQPRLQIGPIPFTPNQDNRDDQLAINLTIPADAAATISIWGFNGTRYRTFSGINNGTAFWNGQLENGQPAPVGPFFITAEIVHNGATTLIRHTGVLWR